jgi:hypothetical protein
VLLSTSRSPLAPLKKQGNGIKVPLFKGDLGGSELLIPIRGLLKHPLRDVGGDLKVFKVTAK